MNDILRLAALLVLAAVVLLHALSELGPADTGIGIGASAVLALLAIGRDRS